MTTRAWACVALLGVLSSGVARAETGAEATTAAAPHPLLREAADTMHHMGMRSDHIRRQLMKARGSHDDKRARCLDDKLSQAHALERMAADEHARLRAALSGGHQAAADARSARLAAYADASRRVLQEARACSGVSKRVRMPTTYRVRMIAPPLPPVGCVCPAATERTRATRPCLRRCVPSG